MTKYSLNFNSESGFGLLEVLVAMVLASLITVGIALNMATALKVGKLTEAHFAASTLANSHIEELAAVDALDLDASYNETDTQVTFPGLNINFNRSTQVVVNADNSRTITVSVTSTHAGIPTFARFSTTLALWE